VLAKPTLSGDVANRRQLTNYGSDAASGFGLWPTSTKDANGQTTTYTYDALGRMRTMRAPGHESGLPTQETTYANWCATTGASSPCVEVDSKQRLTSGSGVLTRQFYDGFNRLVETRAAAPGGRDVVQYTFYNAAGQTAATSVTYFVPAYTGPAGSAAYSIPDTNQAVTSSAYDGLDRLVQATDALSNTGRVASSVVCNAPGTGDATCYEQTLSTDPNSHQQGSLADGFGRAIYAQAYSGDGPGSYAVYSTVKTTYDYLGHTTQIRHPGSVSTTTSSYDNAGRLTSTSDPDRGLMSYVYDSNGNKTQQIDARCGTTLPQPACGAGTIFTGYDGLNHPTWRNNSNGPSGSYGQGHLTAEVFRGGSGTTATAFSGAYTYTYDALGRATRTNQTMGGAGACPTGWTCQDVGGPGQAGGQNYAGDGIWTVQGGGSDIWSTSDQFHFVSQAQAGDAMLSAHVSSQTNTDPWAKAAVMVRAGTAANAPFYIVEVTPGHGVSVQYRDAAGGSAAILASATGTAPISLAVARVGTTYTAYTSSDGTKWSLIQGSSRAMGNLGGTVQMGLAVNAHANGTVSTATFDSVNVTTGGAGACPTGWTCQDVGAPTPAGSQRYLGNGVWTVSGSGADIVGTSDQFRYVSQAQAGDATLAAHVDAQSNTNAWAKAGPMVRASSAANAAFYSVLVSPGNGIFIEYRTSTGGTAVRGTTLTGAAPAYVRVERSGTTYSASTSSDGVTWTAISGSSMSIGALSGTVQLGLAVTSHSSGVLSTATFDQLAPNPSPPGTVTITSPAAPSGVTSYPMQTAYNDAGLPTSLTYSDNEVASYGYDSASGWLASLSTTPSGGSATTLLSNIGYSDTGGAQGRPDSADVAGRGTYSYSASYDADVRLSGLSLTNVGSGTVLFRSLRGYDAAGNVTAVDTTLADGTDNQAFCYDEQNRLTWAGSSGTPSCGSSLTPGSLAGASYSQTFAYDPHSAPRFSAFWKYRNRPQILTP
jgi:YD repeat-containing protein